ncbi:MULTISPECIES: 2-keto-4-pentenoate hydratase [unclassified Nocardia]|uniref:2-keto-4-pentenoate hydratase n=1 Tax=unclassified Nocardia TaxID=2637762 RepID=UPI0033A36444
MLTAAHRAGVATALARAERDQVPVSPLTCTWPDIDVIDAYEIQLLNIGARVRGGARVIGHKIGLSSPAMQQMMGVDEPDYGHLLDDMWLDQDRPVPAGRYLWPRVEVEVAFLLGADLPGADCTERDVLAATAALAPALEIIDSRIENWSIGICDTIADNASSAGFVLGVDRVAPNEVDRRDIDAVLLRNGEILAQGNSDAVLGDPATAVAWLARKVAGFGVRLRAGDVVLPGSCTWAIDARPGDEFVARFGGLGTVRAVFD